VHNGKGLALVVDPEDRLVKQNPAYFKPYVSGDDLTGEFSAPSRYVLDLTGYEQEQLHALPADVLAFLMEVVKPTRTAEALSSYQGLEKRWWTFWNTRETGFREVRQAETCYGIPIVSKYLFALDIPSEWVYTNKVIVVKNTHPWVHEILLSNIFRVWAEHNGGTLGERYCLKVASVIETLPLPVSSNLSNLASRWQDCVGRVVPQLGGVTEVLNAMHDRLVDAPWAIDLRALIREIDEAVISWYGWTIELEHAFHETSRGVRWTISKSAEDPILERLLELNQRCYAEEVGLGLHDKKKPRASRSKAQPNAKAASQLTLSGETPVTGDA
jgi:hypothetical protein